MKKGLLHGFFTGTALRLAGFKEWHLLREACIFPRIAQARTLRGILENSKDTVYGKEHHFSDILAAKSDTEMFELYRKYNKPSEFEDFRPYVNRMRQG